MGQKYSSSKIGDNEKYHSTAAAISSGGDTIGDGENQETKNPAVSANYRDIILDCFGKASSDTAVRILMRIGQQRSDFKAYKDNLTHEQINKLTDLLSKYLSDVIDNINDADKVKELSMDYGSRHVNMRLNGFKPDFFASMADAIATECSFLSESATAHAPTNTFRAWTLLVGLMFSSVRDGFYAELRRQRRQSPSYLKNSRESSTSLEYIASLPEYKHGDSATAENSRSEIEHDVSCEKDTTGSAKSRSTTTHSSVDSDSSGGTIHQAKGSTGEENLDSTSTGRESSRPVAVQRRPHHYRKSKSTSNFAKLPSPPTSKSLDDTYWHSHMERLKRAVKAHAPNSWNSDGPVIGRFVKNPAALADYNAKRRHRIEEIIKHQSPKHFSSKSTTPATPAFDPNKIIDDFINDRYKV